MNSKLNILVACEMSQAICSEMRNLGHAAFSCDLQPSRGGHPEWHIMQDCLPLLDGRCCFNTEDGVHHTLEGRWDLIIAHPPCTFLSVSGNRWFDVEKYGESALRRIRDRQEAIDFFMRFVNADCGHVAIENPIGVMSTRYRRPDQTIQPWHFGDPFVKSTCLWLKNLPLLRQTHFEKPEIRYKEWIDGRTGVRKRQDMMSYNCGKTGDERRNVRARTFPGIAHAIAVQWASYLENQ